MIEYIYSYVVQLTDDKSQNGALKTKTEHYTKKLSFDFG